MKSKQRRGGVIGYRERYSCVLDYWFVPWQYKIFRNVSLIFKQNQKAQPECGYGATDGTAVSISLFATNRFWVVNVFTLMWNSFLQAADSCMQKRSLGAVWEQLVCGPTVGCLLLLGGCYGAGRSHWVLRWCWGTFEGRRTEAFSIFLVTCL